MRRREVRLVNADGSIRTYDAEGRDVHIDAPLSEIAINFRVPSTIVDDLVPVVNVGKQSDLFYTFSQADLWRIPDTVRAPKTAPKEISFGVSSLTYFALNYASRTSISVEDAANADEALALRMNKAQFLTQVLALDRENRASVLLTNTSNVGTVATVTSGSWSDHAVANVIVDIDNAIQSVRGATGYTPNRMALSWEAWNALKFNQNLRSLIFPAPGGATPGAGVPSTAQVAAIFGFDSVLVGLAHRNTAAEGFAASLSPIWGPHAWVYYTPPAPSKETPAWLYNFRWTTAGRAMTIEEWYSPMVKANFLDLLIYEDLKLISAPLATWLSSVV